MKTRLAEFGVLPILGSPSEFGTMLTDQNEKLQW